MKTILIAAFAAVTFASCGGSKNSSSVGIPQRNDVKGNWQVTDIRYSGVATGEKLSFKLLDEGSESCIKGSTWNLPNNGKGSYIINGSGAGCQNGERSIVWSYRKEADVAYFQYKRMEGGVKPKDIEDGYRFRIASVTEGTMILESTVNFEGKPITIIYTLQKT